MKQSVGPEHPRDPTRAEARGAPDGGQLLTLQARSPVVTGTDRPPQDLSAMLDFVDALARLAADLWVEGCLHDFPTDAALPDADE